MSKNFFSTSDDNLYTNRKPLPCQVDNKYAVSKFFLGDFWPKKAQKQR
jgi:hypothetical protein